MLATVAAALGPFVTTAILASKIGSTAIYFAVGTAIVSLLSGVAATARTFVQTQQRRVVLGRAICKACAQEVPARTTESAAFS